MNRQLGFFLLVLVSVQAAHKNILSDSSLKEMMKHPDWISLVEKSSRARALKADDAGGDAPVSEDTPCTSPYSCLDCQTSRVCRPTEDATKPFEQVRLTQCTGLFPYCNSKTGTCDSEVTDICGEKDEYFICMGVQKYPDPDCRVFHVCDDKYTAHKFQCLVEGENYNAVTGSCEANAVCGKFDCTNLQGTKSVHSDYKGYFAYCQEEGKALVVDSCKGNYELNVTSQECEPVCKHDGLVQDLEDCHSYYQCTNLFISKTERYMQREKKTCPANQGFDPQTFQCVPTAQLPSDVHCQ